jgi:GNAT superfamily N-acetyltransferase
VENLSGITIAPEPPDSELASQLLARYYTELDSRFPEGFDPLLAVAVPAAELSAPLGTFLVAYLDGKPVGCGAMRRLDETSAEIKRMWVDPAARHCGVGRGLLRALEEAAAEADCEVVRLDTSVHLDEAISLYRSSSYQEIDPYNDNCYAGCWFEKRLC